MLGVLGIVGLSWILWVGWGYYQHEGLVPLVGGLLLPRIPLCHGTVFQKDGHGGEISVREARVSGNARIDGPGG